MKRFPLIISLLIALSALPNAQMLDKRASEKEQRRKKLQYYIDLIASSPKEAARGLKSLDTPSSKAYLAYLYYTRKVPVKSHKAQVSRLIKEASDLIADYESSCTGFPREFRFRNLRDLLRAVRFISGADSEDVITPCWIFRKHPQEAFEAFGAYWASSCDLAPELCQDYQRITAIDSVNQLSKIVIDIRRKEGIDRACYGTMIFADYRSWDIEDMKASMSPRLLLGDPHNHRALLAKRLRTLRIWSNEGFWNKEKYRSLVAIIPRAIEDLKSYYVSKFGMKVKQAKAASKIAVTLLLEHTDFGPDEDDTKNTSDDIVYKIFAKPYINAQQVGHLIASGRLKPETYNRALRYAVVNDFSINIIRLLVNKGARPDVGNESALVMAVKRPDVTRYFLQSGANSNQQDPYGKTPLFYAIQYDALESAKVLIEIGADVDHALKSNEELEKDFHGVRFLYKPLFF